VFNEFNKLTDKKQPDILNRIGSRSAKYIKSLKNHRLKLRDLLKFQTNILPDKSKLIYLLIYSLPDRIRRKLSASEIETNLEEIFGVKVTPRTLIYIEKRLGGLNF